MSLQDVIELHLQNYRDLFKNLYAIYSYYVVSTILISARLFARLYMLKNGGLDDTFAVIAFVRAGKPYDVCNARSLNLFIHRSV